MDGGPTTWTRRTWAAGSRRLRRCGHRGPARPGQPRRSRGRRGHRHRAAANTAADQLVAAGADVVVLLVHEGAPSTNCATMTRATRRSPSCSGTSAPNIDAVISGHTHLEYACSSRCRSGRRPDQERPVLSAGQYGVASNQLVYSFDTTTGDRSTSATTSVVKGPGSTLFSYPRTRGQGDRRPGRRGRRGTGQRGPRPDRRSVQAGPPRRRRHREPWWRVDAGQPRRRDPAVGDPDAPTSSLLRSRS